MKNESTAQNIDISIIVPACNESEFISGLLDSVNRYLNVPSYEIIVVDNGSTDDTRIIASQYDFVTVVPLPDKVFPSVARNRGIEVARGNIIVFLDADVVISRKWADSLLQLNSGQRELPGKYITGSSYHISMHPCWIEKYWFEPLRSKSKSYINGGNIITTRDVIELLGGFDETLETGEDVDFSARARNSSVSIVISEDWEVYHEGFPKSVSAFIKRESWHGKSDFCSIKSVLRSKIALGTVMFLILHFWLILALFGVDEIQDLMHWVRVLPVLGIVIISTARAVLDIPVHGVWQLIVSSVISYLYFIGRSQSIWRVATEK